MPDFFDTKPIVFDSPNADYSVIWLHGLGADGGDFAAAKPLFDQALSPHIGQFVFPHAPMQPVTINGGFVMRAWYDISMIDLEKSVDKTGIQKSVEAVSILVKELHERYPERAIFLGGFSQGGVIALCAGLQNNAAPISGVIGLSTYLPTALQCPQKIPVFLSHGTLDPVVPIAAAKAALSALESKELSVSWHTSDIEHTVDEITWQRLFNWMKEILSEEKV